MVASDKIEEAKECFKGITESGKNNYQHFTYFETKDIFPVVRKVCKKYKLKTVFFWDVEMNVMTLTVTDREDNSSETFYLPVPVPTDTKAGNYMQSIGSIQTYAMRYLYIQCFEITVPDEIDSQDQKKTKVRDVSHLNKPKPKPKPKPVQQHTREEEPTEEDIKTALDNIYHIITVEGGAEFTLEKALFQLKRKYKDKPQLIAACEKSLKTNTAQQVKEGANPKHD